MEFEKASGVCFVRACLGAWGHDNCVGRVVTMCRVMII